MINCTSNYKVSLALVAKNDRTAFLNLCFALTSHNKNMMILTSGVRIPLWGVDAGFSAETV